MSFILDALRKSEHERQRQTGPALAEVSVAAPKPRTNAWATAAIALLLVNLVALGVILIRKASQAPTASTPSAAAEAGPARSQAPAAEAPAPQADGPATVSITQPAAAPVVAPSPPPMLQPAASPDAGGYGGERNPLEDEVSADSGPSLLDPTIVEDASAPPAGPPAVTRSGSTATGRRGSVVYESLPDEATLSGGDYSAAPASSRPTSPAAGRSLPTADELAASGGVPALNLELHVYSTKPVERMVFVNSRRYKEGDTLQEGPVVRQITPDGAILEFNGRQFLLQRD